ncbi:UDP-N-acetylglucosamine transporter [Coprinopsis sp. MPI-PUGE-AT-0042]|nr:UDP-N-acetylglucosamine transporter [Coprinopsis sp. MPI-PUGE-AT-0042]
MEYPNFLTWTRYGPRFKPRQIPLLPYLGQVALFYGISLLNNAAFGYNIPMSVHIIFRSGGLVVSMLLGWLISKKRYNATQVLAVFLVTAGVALTTLSASQPASKTSATSNPYTYATGIGILSLALFLSGFLGLLQDWTYSTYGKTSTQSAAPSKPKGKGKGKTPQRQRQNGPAAWQESMFYLHFLGLPMFLPLLGDIRKQVAIINYDSPRALFNVPVPSSLASVLDTTIPPPYSLPSLVKNSFVYPASTNPHAAPDSLAISLPKPYLPLVLNTLTQLLCVAGVNRLTTRVSSLTVTLILVVRKAVSLVISLKGAAIVQVLTKPLGRIDYGRASGVVDVFSAATRTLLGLDVEPGKVKKAVEVNEGMLWTGAALVLVGTIAYSIGTGWSKKQAQAQTKKGKTE